MQCCLLFYWKISNPFNNIPQKMLFMPWFCTRRNWECLYRNLIRMDWRLLGMEISILKMVIIVDTSLYYKCLYLLICISVQYSCIIAFVCGCLKDESGHCVYGGSSSCKKWCIFNCTNKSLTSIYNAFCLHVVYEFICTCTL